MKPRGGGVSDVQRVALEEDLAGIGPVDASKHLHQRRLAAAVLAHQRVNLPWGERNGNVGHSLNAGEGLGNMAKLPDRRGLAH